MKKILFIQPDCRSYRIPLFEKLSVDYNISILHFGGKVFNSNYHIKEIFLKKYQLLSFKYIKGLKKKCANYDIIIVVFDFHWINSFFLPLFVDKPVIFWGHGLGKSKIVAYLKMLVGKKANAVITYDQKGKNGLINIGLKPEKIFVAPNTIYVSNSKNFSKEQKNSILYVGRLQKRKELDVLIKSFANVQHKIPKNTILTILGDGNKILYELRKIINDLGISDKIEFINGTSDEKILSEQFKKAYCYASPGPVGLGVLHSFSYGIPILTFRKRKHGPEISNVLHKKNGLLVEDGIQNFSGAIFEIIGTGIYKELGDNAYQYYIKKRTIDHMAQGFKKAIENSTKQ